MLVQPTAHCPPAPARRSVTVGRSVPRCSWMLPNRSLPVPADARVMRGFDILVSETRSRTIYDPESETRDRAVTFASGWPEACALFGAGFAMGEISELFQHNVGISAGRWDVVLAGSVIGAAIGITCAVLRAALVVAQRRVSRRVGSAPAAGGSPARALKTVRRRNRSSDCAATTPASSLLRGGQAAYSVSSSIRRSMSSSTLPVLGRSRWVSWSLSSALVRPS